MDWCRASCSLSSGGGGDGDSGGSGGGGACGRWSIASVVVAIGVCTASLGTTVQCSALSTLFIQWNIVVSMSVVEGLQPRVIENYGTDYAGSEANNKFIASDSCENDCEL